MKIPEGVSVSVSEGQVTVKGPTGELHRLYNPSIVNVKVEGGEVAVTLKGRSNRKNNAQVNTIQAHIKNMLSGVQKKFEKKMQLVYSHFPVTIEIKGKEISIKNFLGEKTARKTKLKGSATVEIKGADITVTGSDKEDVGQTASNLVRATRITKRDIRVFQDGIYYA